MIHLWVRAGVEESQDSIQFGESARRFFRNILEGRVIFKGVEMISGRST
jgi:hypothetical protein